MICSPMELTVQLKRKEISKISKLVFSNSAKEKIKQRKERKYQGKGDYNSRYGKLTKKLNFECRSGEGEGVSYIDIWRRVCQAETNSCKGPWWKLAHYV